MISLATSIATTSQILDIKPINNLISHPVIFNLDNSDQKNIIFNEQS